MKRVLIIKTSSLGDVIHTLPALTDAKSALGDVQFDWVVEENFAEIPAWHPAVNKVIPLAIRRWRKHILQTIFSGEWRKFKKQLHQVHYDAVIDAQGLLKSALITRMARGATYGLDKQSAREPIATRFYQYPQAIAKQQHAVERIRALFSKSLGYPLTGLTLDYGLADHGALDSKSDSILEIQRQPDNIRKHILFLHGTTWDTKHWPEQYWFELANLVTAQGYMIKIPWGNEVEQQRALRIKAKCERGQQVFVMEKMDLNELAEQIKAVDAVVAVDTGLAHLSAALDKATVALYGPTSPGLTGTYGKNQLHLQADFECAPCFKKNCDRKRDNISPECYSNLIPQQVLNALNKLLV